MQDIGKVHNFKFRVTLTVILVLGGFAFPMLFVLAALIGWSIINDIRNPPQELDEWFTRRYTTTADDSRWRSDFLQFCESPAETAFLEAMIDAYNLTPNKGVLCGNGLTLDLQVKMPPYRADFLVNNWLVVEIDGAAYHSSREAVERDRVRDETMTARGYSVLRIPAKVVFSTPEKAVHLVRASIAQGNQAAEREKTKSQEQAKPKMTFTELLDRLNNAVSEIQKNASITLAAEKANKGYANAFHLEQLAVKTAIEDAESQIKVEQFMSQSEEHREIFLRNYERYSGLVTKGAKPTISIPLVPEKGTHPDPLTNQAIDRARQVLTAERDKFFSDTRARLHGDEKLKELVRQNLSDMGCGECWKYISNVAVTEGVSR